MGKEVFVTTILSDQMIEAGTAILEYIDRSGWVVEDAFWLRESDEEVWRLVLASPGVSCTGAKPLYAAIQKVIAEAPAERWIVELEHIAVVDTDHRIVRALRHGILPFHPDPAGYRLFRAFVERQYIEESYLYRLTRTVDISCPVVSNDPVDAFIAWGHLDVLARNVAGASDGSVIAHGRTEITPEGVVAHIDLPCRYGVDAADQARCTIDTQMATRWADDQKILHIVSVTLEPIG